METTVEFLKKIWELTGGVLFDHGHFLSIVPLIVALVIATVVVVVRLSRKSKGRIPSARRVFAMLFPRRIFLHQSAKLDYAVFVINQIVLFVIAISAVISPTIVAVIVSSLVEAIGLQPADGDITMTERVLCSIYLVLLWDFSATYAHYLKHKVPILWELHKVHHSAEVMTPATALRRHPLEAIFGALVSAIVIGLGIVVWQYVFGLNVSSINIFGTLLGVWLWRVAGYNLRHSHIWISYGDFWNRIFISPAQHQVHHSKSPEHYDTNFGHIFSFWDKLFGTLYLPRHDERMKFGIDDEEMHEYRSLFGLYITPLIKIWRRIRPSRRQSPVTPPAE